MAIGWIPEDLTGKSMEEIAGLIKESEYENEISAIGSFEKFFLLAIGDYVAVNNTNHGLFGIGTVKSGYRFNKNGHDSGAETRDEFYSHFIDVEWKFTSYVRRQDILGAGETAWMPYGTMGSLLPEVPMYIKRLLGEVKEAPVSKVEYVYSDWIQPVIDSINVLKKDTNHQERAHESLVEDFFCALGYNKHQDIKYRQGRVDITIYSKGRPELLVEVKRDWDLSYDNSKGAIQQAYKYAHEQGIRYVVVTNGDFYLLFDRLKGLSYESNVIGEFQLTGLQEEDLETIDRLRRQNLEQPDLEELFRYLSESFSERKES